MSNIKKEDILGIKREFIPDRRKIDPALDPTYIRYDTKLPASGFLLACRNLKEALRELKTVEPQVYANFFPRIYRDVPEYDWRWANYCSAMHVVLAKHDANYVKEYDSQRNAMTFAAVWQASGANQFFVTRELYDAVANTEPPAGIDYEDFKMPFSAVVFQLPKGTLKFLGEDCTYIGLAKVSPGDYEIKGQTSTVRVNLEYPKFIFTTAVKGREMFIGISADAAGLKKILEGGVEVLAYSEEVGGARHVASKKITPDVQFSYNIIRISLNLILAMEVQPQLVERGRFVSYNKKDTRSELWEPNRVGRRYRVKYEGGVPPGSHASPRMHWRRGHFRRQRTGPRYPVCVCGEGYAMHAGGGYCQLAGCGCLQYKPATAAEYKTVWIEPVLVNAKVTEAK